MEGQKIPEGTYKPIAEVTKLLEGDQTKGIPAKVASIINSDSGFVGTKLLTIGQRRVTHAPTKRCSCGGEMIGVAHKPGETLEESQTLLVCLNPADLHATIALPSSDYPFLTNHRKRKEVITTPAAEKRP